MAATAIDWPPAPLSDSQPLHRVERSKTVLSSNTCFSRVKRIYRHSSHFSESHSSLPTECPMYCCPRIESGVVLNGGSTMSAHVALERTNIKCADVHCHHKANTFMAATKGRTGQLKPITIDDLMWRSMNKRFLSDDVRETMTTSMVPRLQKSRTALLPILSCCSWKDTTSWKEFLVSRERWIYLSKRTLEPGKFASSPFPSMGKLVQISAHRCLSLRKGHRWEGKKY